MVDEEEAGDRVSVVVVLTDCLIFLTEFEFINLVSFATEISEAFLVVSDSVKKVCDLCFQQNYCCFGRYWGYCLQNCC